MYITTIISRHPQSMSMVMPAPGAYYMPWYPHQGTVPAQVSSMHGTFQGAGTGRGSALPGSAPPQHVSSRIPQVAAVI